MWACLLVQRTVERLQQLKRRGITVNGNIAASLDFKNPYLLEVSEDSECPGLHLSASGSTRRGLRGASDLSVAFRAVVSASLSLLGKGCD